MVAFLRSIIRKLGFHVHDWGNWETIGDISSTVHNGKVGECQRSECKICKKARVNKIWTC